MQPNLELNVELPNLPDNQAMAEVPVIQPEI